jgi:hypothetical protein
MNEARGHSGASTTAQERLPIEGHLYAYWEQGMEEVAATLDPTPPGAKQLPQSELIWLTEGDLLVVRSKDGQHLWRGIVKPPGWFKKGSLPPGWEDWFDLKLPAVLLERRRVPFWRRGREEALVVTQRKLRAGRSRDQ